jgi:hypothetical protein
MKIGISLVIATLLLYTPNASPSENEPEKKYNRDDAYWYFGVGLGVGVQIFNFHLYKGTKDQVCPGTDFWGYSFAMRAGAVFFSYVLLGLEYHVVGDGGSVFHYYGGGLTFFPSEDLGLYFRTSLNYGTFDYRKNTYTSPQDGKGNGYSLRAGAGYGFQVGDAFTPEIEISYNCMFAGQGVLSSISLMLFLSWY